MLIIYINYNKKSKGKFLYSAVSNPQDLSKRFTLYFPDRPVHSDTISASLGSIQPYATINAQRLLVHISTTVYSQVSFIQLSELEQCRVKKLTRGFNTAAQDSNPGSCSREPEALPMNNGALKSPNRSNKSYYVSSVLLPAVRWVIVGSDNLPHPARHVESVEVCVVLPPSRATEHVQVLAYDGHALKDERGQRSQSYV